MAEQQQVRVEQPRSDMETDQMTNRDCRQTRSSVTSWSHKEVDKFENQHVQTNTVSPITHPDDHRVRRFIEPADQSTQTSLVDNRYYDANGPAAIEPRRCTHVCVNCNEDARQIKELPKPPKDKKDSKYSNILWCAVIVIGLVMASAIMILLFKYIGTHNELNWITGNTIHNHGTQEVERQKNNTKRNKDTQSPTIHKKNKTDLDPIFGMAKYNLQVQTENQVPEHILRWETTRPNNFINNNFTSGTMAFTNNRSCRVDVIMQVRTTLCGEHNDRKTRRIGGSLFAKMEGGGQILDEVRESLFAGQQHILRVSLTGQHAFRRGDHIEVFVNKPQCIYSGRLEFLCFQSD